MARAKRHPGVIVHDLQWSMAHDRPVRVLLGDTKTVTGKVVRLFIDERREKQLMRLAPTERKRSERSSMVAEFEDGRELAVDSIEKVKKPVGDAGATFAG